MGDVLNGEAGPSGKWHKRPRMLVRSLLYISDSALMLPDDEWQVDAIVDVARSRNAALGVTGALMFAHTNFVQVLEGSQAALDELMASIRRDRRHHDVRVLEEERLACRRFPGWAMAYVGPAALVEARLSPLLKTRGAGVDPFATQDMIALLRSFISLGEG